MPLFVDANLSNAAKALWGKKSREGDWLPLYIHLSDSARVANKLWNLWISDGVRDIVRHGVGSEDDAERLFIFLAAAHDLGKAIPAFQAKPSTYNNQYNDLDEQINEHISSAGLKMQAYNEFLSPTKTPHALATQILLDHFGCKKSITAILGAHHGKPQDNNYEENYGLDAYGKNYNMGENGKDAWTAVQHELLNYALKLSGFLSLDDLPEPNMPAQVLLSGLIIVSDWIASDDSLFPLIPIDRPLSSLKQELEPQNRIGYAWAKLELPSLWESDILWADAPFFKKHFHYEPNAIQRDLLNSMNNIEKPGIVILEAPMGQGKTEAALAAAEILGHKTKRTGVFFALPTQATSDGIFPRFKKWVEILSHESKENFSLRLSHGKAQFNPNYKSMWEGGTNIGNDEEFAPIVHSWFKGSKKALLADFVVGTIDQLLLAALKHKFVMLRHIGLANKVVIIDEVHAYDAYMSKYLERTLRWLGCYSVPVVLLSATLPMDRRNTLINAYMGKKSSQSVDSSDYPIITYSDGNNIQQLPIKLKGSSHTVIIEHVDEENIIDTLEAYLSEGGCAGVIVNTVKRSQKLAHKLRERFGKSRVRLLHSRFLAPDRAANEQWLLEKLGKAANESIRPDKCIVVGSQVLEQSLDIDFDILITDLCPMDLLLQRIGRLQRHTRKRPSIFNISRCLVIGLKQDEINSGSMAVYKEYPLMKTKALMPQSISLPEDISRLVQNAYGPDTEAVTSLPRYSKAKKEWEDIIQSKEGRAGVFQICEPWPDKNIINWLNTDVAVSESAGEASVRDTDESIEVIAVQEIGGKLHFFPWINDGKEIPSHTVPDSDTAQSLACQSLRLPAELCTPWRIERTITELENLCKQRFPHWQDSVWLKGSLFVIFDSECKAYLNGHVLSYSVEDGLMCREDNKGDETND